MTALSFSLAFAVLVLLVLFIVAWRQPGARPETLDPHHYQLTELLSLRAVFYPRVAHLFDRTDFDYLQGLGADHAARELRAERGRAALLWLKQLRSDVRQLVLFQRALARVGFRLPVGNGISLSVDAATFLLAYWLLYLSVWMGGPYLLPGIRGLLMGCTRSMLQPLDQLSSNLPPPLPKLLRAHFARMGPDRLS